MDTESLQLHEPCLYLSNLKPRFKIGGSKPAKQIHKDHNLLFTYASFGKKTTMESVE